MVYIYDSVENVLKFVGFVVKVYIFLFELIEG